MAVLFPNQLVVIMRYLVRQRLHIDDKYRDIIQKAVNNNIKLCHFERSGKRSIWGGFLDKNTGEWVDRIGWVKCWRMSICCCKNNIWII
jgi:hypothetical protein